jgi:hypothetical protein
VTIIFATKLGANPQVSGDLKNFSVFKELATFMIKAPKTTAEAGQSIIKAETSTGHVQGQWQINFLERATP